MKVQYVAAVYDSSGYAEAARNNISALMRQPNIELTVKPVSFENWRTNLGDEFRDIEPLINKPIKPDVNIIHLTPENFPRCKVPGIKNIGCTVWETTKLPDTWTSLCNQLDEIWVPCDWNIEVFKNSGVTVPIKKVPHTIDLEHIQTLDSQAFPSVDSNLYNFYSIFQWSSRKNPTGLISAYLSEFRPTDKVCLVLKTYLNNNSEQDKQQIIDLIKSIKRDLQLDRADTAPIVLVHGGLSKLEIKNLHRSCDCFVLPHRSEGWGVPHFEAMALGKPVITTGFSGNLEFMNGNTSYLLSFNMAPVSGMGRPTYNGWMDWAEPNLDNLRYYMRWVYDHQEEGKEKAKIGKDFIKKFDWSAIGPQMRALLCD